MKTAARMTYHYPVASLVPDGIRALVGLAFTAGPLAILPVAPWFGIVLAAGVVLFGAFALLTALRVRTRVRVDEGGIEVSPGRGRIRWTRLERVKLRYFAVRRERERKRGEGGRRGWMQLVLGGDGRVVRIDSRLDGFDDVLQRAVTAAAGLDLALDPVTRANLEAAGMALAAAPAGSSPPPAGEGEGGSRDD